MQNERSDLYAITTDPTLRIEVPHFNVGVETLPDQVVIIALEGETDIYTATKFKQVLLGVIAEGYSRIVIDTTKVTFMDSSGLSVFISGERRLRPRSSLLIVCKDDIVRLLRITGLDRVFSLYSSREEAVKAAVDGTAGKSKTGT